MKVHITGPLGGLNKDLELPHMHLTVEMDVLPRPGEIIVLNDGSTYTVQYVMRWIDTVGPADVAYHEYLGSGQQRDLEGDGILKHISVVVEPAEGGFMTAHRMTDALRVFADMLTEAAGSEEQRKARYAKMIKGVTT